MGRLTAAERRRRERLRALLADWIHHADRVRSEVDRALRSIDANIARWRRSLP
jgi:hypothetical protein